jgi:hypothetical protein
MVDLFRRMLHREREATAGPFLRPNELRRDVVRAERLRRESLQPRREPDTGSATEPRREDRPPQAVALPRTGTPHPAMAGLKSRSKLREALLLNEILGPPRSLRGPREDA